MRCAWIAAVAAAVLVIVGGAAASGDTLMWTSQTMPLPAGAPATNVTGSAIACPSVGNCVAASEYLDGSKVLQASLLSEANGSWSASGATPPTAAHTGTGVHLSDVACGAVGQCLAVGNYVDSSGVAHGLLFSDQNGTWTQGAVATLPANASVSAPSSDLQSVACPATGDCVAVGGYTDSNGNSQGLILVQSGTGWTAHEATLPAGAAANPALDLQAVACSAAGECAAVGDYTDNAGYHQGLLLSDSGGTWQPGVDAVPPLGPGDPSISLDTVSCGAAGDCAAGGSYTYYAAVVPLLVNETGGVWGGAISPRIPQDAQVVGGNGLIDSVSCPAAGVCSASGYYARSSGGYGSLLYDVSANTSHNWTLESAQVPTNAASGASTSDYLTDISCPQPNECGAVGEYLDNAGHWQDVLFFKFDGAAGAGWGAGREVSLPSGANQQGANSYDISCSLPRNCVATGDYHDTNGNRQGLLITSATPGVAQAGHAKVAGTTAQVPLSCVGGTPCQVKLQLTAGKTVVGKASATVQPGQTKTATVSLNSAGKRLLKKKHKLAATLTVTQGKTVISRQQLKFRR
jgi:hypothetical protein